MILGDKMYKHNFELYNYVQVTLTRSINAYVSALSDKITKK